LTREEGGGRISRASLYEGGKHKTYGRKKGKIHATRKRDRLEAGG